jgi:hypothetical protein
MMIDPKDPIYTEYLRSELDRQIHILRTNPNSAKHKALFELIKTRLDKRVD